MDRKTVLVSLITPEMLETVKAQVRIVVAAQTSKLYDFMGDGRGYYDHEDIRTSLHHLALYG